MRRGTVAAVAATALVTAGLTMGASAQPAAPEPDEGESRETASGPRQVTTLTGQRLSLQGDAVVPVLDGEAPDYGPVVQAGAQFVPASLRPLMGEQLDPRLFDAEVLAEVVDDGQEIPLVIEVADVEGAPEPGEVRDRLSATTGLAVDADQASEATFTTSVAPASAEGTDSIRALITLLEEDPSTSGIDGVRLGDPKTGAVSDAERSHIADSAADADPAPAADVTLTIEAIDEQGEPAGEFAYPHVVSMDDETVYTDFVTFEDGVHTVVVPEGNYLVAADFGPRDDDTWAIATDPAVVVDGDTTIGLDARGTEPYEVQKHRRNVVESKNLLLSMIGESSPGGYGLGFLYLESQDGRFFTTASGATTAVGEFASGYMEIAEGVERDQGASLLPRLPYTYRIATSEQRLPVPDELTIVADQDTMATVRSSHYAVSEDESTLPYAGWLINRGEVGLFGVALQTEHSGQWIDYLSPGLTWEKYSWLEYASGGNLLADLTARPREYEAGEQTDISWGAQVHRPGLVEANTPEDASVVRSGDTLAIQLPFFVDASGHHSTYVEGTTSDLEVYADGELVGQTGGTPELQVDVAPGQADYRVVLDVVREGEWWQRSTSATTEWTFPSATASGDVVLPLLEPRVAAQRLDELNQVTRTVDVDVAVGHQYGSETDAEITDVTLEWADGGDWQPVEVEAGEGDGVYTGRLDLPEGTEGVDLRVTASDSNGASVTSEITEALVVETSVTRTAGGDRYETAAAVARLHGFSEVAYLASGEEFPDALSVGGVAGALEAPVLLTQPGGLSAITRESLLEVGAGEVRILGETDAVSAAVETELEELGYDVTRIGGGDRFETAALLADGAPTGGVAVVASGEVYADALSGGPLSAQDGRPVLLVRDDHLPQTTAAALAELAPEEIVLLGGTERITPAVEASLGEIAPVTRVAGSDRYETAWLAGELLIDAAPEGTGTAYLASGLDWPDALTLGARSGAENDPVLLTKDDALPSATASALVELDRRRVIAAGGTTAITEGVLETVATLLDD